LSAAFVIHFLQPEKQSQLDLSDQSGIAGPSQVQPIEQSCHRPAMPAATSRRGDLPLGQFVSDLLDRQVAKLDHDRPHCWGRLVSCVILCKSVKSARQSSWGGAVTFAKKVASLAESFSKPIAFHDFFGPVTLAASTQLATVSPNVTEQEMTRAFYYDWYSECVDQLPPVENGRIYPAEGSGHDLTLDSSIIKRPDAIVRATSS
jgi:hypothetical protein